MSERNAGGGKRVFLFLQGPASSLFYRLANRLESFGFRCLRINLNAGDWLFWRRAGGLNYRGTQGAWPDYVEEVMGSMGVTDLILLGEERPYHRAAIDVATKLGIETTVVEMGYLRPDWVTVEKDGMSSNSRFPNEPNVIREAGREIPAQDYGRRYGQSFLVEASLDLAYNLPNVFLSVFYPGYRRHGLFHPLREYWGWIRRILNSKKERKKSNLLVDAVVKSQTPFFVYPLQLETDYQLRSHSPYTSQSEAIREVITSFARHSLADAELVVKIHPLDNGLMQWRDLVNEIATSEGVAKRVRFLDGGDLSVLSAACVGFVTVNSTAVLDGLRKGVPAKVLGAAIYDVDGITHQGTLDDFWRKPAKPDAELVSDFFNLLAASIHVRGNFYSRKGAEAAASAIAHRLVNNQINFPGGDCGYPPRRRPQKKRTRCNLSAL